MSNGLDPQSQLLRVLRIKSLGDQGVWGSKESTEDQTRIKRLLRYTQVVVQSVCSCSHRDNGTIDKYMTRQAAFLHATRHSVNGIKKLLRTKRLRGASIAGQKTGVPGLLVHQKQRLVPISVEEPQNFWYPWRCLDCFRKVLLHSEKSANKPLAVNFWGISWEVIQKTRFTEQLSIKPWWLKTSEFCKFHVWTHKNPICELQRTKRAQSLVKSKITH